MKQLALTLLLAFVAQEAFGDVTPMMESAFMTKLKSAVEHKDRQMFSELMNFQKTPNKKRIKFVTSWEPFPTILSDEPRGYEFKRLQVPLRAGNGISVKTFDDPWRDAGAPQEAEVQITFRDKSPVTKSNLESLPLVVQNGELKIVIVASMSL